MTFDPSLVEPFWASTVMHKESLFFVSEADGESSARLLFPPDAVLFVTSASEEVEYEEGRDYVVSRPIRPEGVGYGDGPAGRIVRPRGSRIPVTTGEEVSQLWRGPDEEFHRRTTAITYTHAADLWRGSVPRSAGGHLHRTMERLRRGDPLTLCVTGDSISQGYNASGFMNLQPHQPPYATLVASALERSSGSPITLHNFAVEAWTSDHGLYVDDVVASNPDLVLIAYGMNDAGYADAGAFSANIERIISMIRAVAPVAEFVVVSPMRPHPGWDYAVHSRFPEYRDALAALCGPGVALADLTTLWTDLLRHKSFYELTGNGFNHPNDFGHRLYAQVILALLDWKR